MNTLSFDEQLAHSIFCQQIQGVKVENAKQLLVDLHLIYLSQQATIAYLTTQNIFNSLTTQSDATGTKTLIKLQPVEP